MMRDASARYGGLSSRVVLLCARAVRAVRRKRGVRVRREVVW